jgi:hypothetical protein
MKVVWIIVGGILIGAVVGGAFFLIQSNKTTHPVELAPVEVEATPIPTIEVKTLKHQNEAGFSFDYPSDVTIKENELGSVSYADLTLLTLDQRYGSITIKIIDTKLKNNAAWQKANKLDQTAQTEDTMLGDVKALKITESVGTKLIAVGQSVLYTIEVNSQNDEYWIDIFDQVVSSWKFELPASPTSAKSSGSSSQPSSGGDIYEEETIE